MFMNQQGKYRIVFWLMTILFVVNFTVSCQQNSTDRTERVRDSVLWEDSAYQLSLKANELSNAGQIDSLETFVPKAMQICLEHNQMERYYIIWRVLIEKYIWHDEFEKAMTEVRQMQEDAIKRNVNHGLFEAYSLLGLGYAYHDNAEESIKYFSKAIDIFDSPNATPLMEAYKHLAQVYNSENLYNELGFTLTKWKAQIDKNHYLNTSVTKGEWASWNFAYQRMLAEYMKKTHHFGAALDILDSAEYYLRLEDTPTLDRIQLFNSRSELAQKLHDFATALHYSDSTMDLRTKDTEGIDNNYWINAMKLKIQALEGLERYKEALDLQHRLNEFKDSLTTAGNIEQLNQLNKRFEVNELKTQAEQSETKAKERQLILIGLLAIVIILTLVSFLILRYIATVNLEKEHKKLIKAYEQLEVANAKAEESQKMKSSLIKQLSHEINTPLNILSGFTQIITMPDMELNSDEREELNKGIVENTNRISELVRKVVDLSDISSQATIECNDSVEVASIAANAIESSGISSAKHLTFDSEIPIEVGSTVITTNQKSASRAIALLLDNARKFTAPAETIAKQQGDLTTDDKKHATLTISRDEAQIKFTVEDNGIGIPTEEAEHIFEEFVQLDDFYDGTGIGLTVARSIARKLGGDIILDTSYRGGARFIMTLPL